MKHLVDNVEKIDFQVRGEGTLWLLWPISNEAVAWCDEHLPEDAPMFGNAFAIEARYAEPIFNGLIEDGLVGRTY